MTIQELIQALDEYAAYCDKITTENLSHKIANLKHSLMNTADLLEITGIDGWHPASELPPVDAYGNSEKVVGIRVFPEGIPTGPFFVRVVNNEWNVKYVTWWCYPPKEE